MQKLEASWNFVTKRIVTKSLSSRVCKTILCSLLYCNLVEKASPFPMLYNQNYLNLVSQEYVEDQINFSSIKVISVSVCKLQQNLRSTYPNPGYWKFDPEEGEYYRLSWNLLYANALFVHYFIVTRLKKAHPTFINEILGFPYFTKALSWNVLR